MKVKELIEELQKANPSMDVVIDTKSNPMEMEDVEGVQIQLNDFVIFSK